MKAKEITLNLTRNLGNHEFAKMAVTYEINEGDDVIDSFKSAQLEINEAFDALFPEYYGYRNGDNYVEKTGKTDGINVIDDFGTTTIMYDDRKINTKTELTENSPEYEQIKARLKKGTMTLDELKEYYELNSDITNKLLTN